MNLLFKKQVVEWLQKQCKTLTVQQRKVLVWALFISYVLVTLGVVITTFF